MSCLKIWYLNLFPLNICILMSISLSIIYIIEILSQHLPYIYYLSPIYTYHLCIHYWAADQKSKEPCVIIPGSFVCASELGLVKGKYWNSRAWRFLVCWPVINFPWKNTGIKSQTLDWVPRNPELWEAKVWPKSLSCRAFQQTCL